MADKKRFARDFGKGFDAESPFAQGGGFGPMAPGGLPPLRDARPGMTAEDEGEEKKGGKKKTAKKKSGKKSDKDEKKSDKKK